MGNPRLPRQLASSSGAEGAGSPVVVPGLRPAVSRDHYQDGRNVASLRTEATAWKPHKGPLPSRAVTGVQTDAVVEESGCQTAGPVQFVSSEAQVALRSFPFSPFSPLLGLEKLPLLTLFALLTLVALEKLPLLTTGIEREGGGGEAEA